MSILVTGGAGFIGSHTVVELINAGFEPVIADNFSNSSPVVIDRIEKITGKRPTLYTGDVRDVAFLTDIFEKENIESVIHFAGYKAVGESCEKPLMYFDNNFISTIKLLEVCEKFGVKKFVFSSSATVYGIPETVPLEEGMPLSCTNPYGRTKLVIEDMLRDIYKADNSLSIMLLRYFNPIGAHESGLIGEDPAGIPNNLLPYITQVAIGRLARLGVFGNDYPTVDGTGVRDYIHVVDLAKGHVKALEWADKNTGCEAVNLGTGNGYSVLQIVKAFEDASGMPVPYDIKPRRDGDVAENFCDPAKAKSLLGWQAEYDIEKMCIDSWNWQKNNPNGYNN